MNIEDKYKPEYCEIAYLLMKNGKSKIRVCAELGICKQTLYNWADRHPEFKKALEIGVTASEAYWEDLGQNHIIRDLDEDGKATISFDTGLYMINMRNRFGWRATDASDKIESDKSNVAVMTEAFVAAQAAIAEVEKLKNESV